MAGKDRSLQPVVMRMFKVTSEERERIRALKREKETMRDMLYRMEAVLTSLYEKGKIPRKPKPEVVPVRLDMHPKLAKLFKRISREKGQTQVDILRMVVEEMEKNHH